MSPGQIDSAFKQLDASFDALRRDVQAAVHICHQTTTFDLLSDRLGGIERDLIGLRGDVSKLIGASGAAKFVRQAALVVITILLSAFTSVQTVRVQVEDVVAQITKAAIPAPPLPRPQSAASKPEVRRHESENGNQK